MQVSMIFLTGEMWWLDDVTSWIAQSLCCYQAWIPEAEALCAMWSQARTPPTSTQLVSSPPYTFSSSPVSLPAPLNAGTVKCTEEADQAIVSRKTWAAVAQ